jgi:hypothetical protein
MNKSALLAVSLLFLGSGVFAQQKSSDKSNYPYWTISKEIQRMNFRNTVQQDASISTGNAVVVSKHVNKINARPVRTGIVVRTGTPASVISKGVARWQIENQ